ncbi:MAG: TonB-dependent receptor [Bacteroidetes bacterium]|nr:TonB-dependent receptor [Bacteroidota bacterium]
MRTKVQFRLWFLVGILAVSMSVSALAQGTVTGTVVDVKTKAPLKSARVQINKSSRYVFTGSNGTFRLENIPAGDQTVVVSLVGRKSNIKSNVKVTDGKTTEVNFEMDEWETKFDEVTVYGASKRKEKVTETPAAVTVITTAEIQRAARGNQLGRALEGLTGVDVVQNGTTDFNVNTRGFNNSTNRRLLVLVDGRDVALQQIGATEWNSFQLPLDEFSRIEMVHGPAAALYGANAFNGVLNMTSYSPREVLGTKVTLLAGEYNTLREDVRHAGAWDALSYKITAGHAQSTNISRNRTAADSNYFEYKGFAPEQQELREEDRNTFSTYGTLRMDYDLNAEDRILGEVGYTQFGDEVMLAGSGRIHVPKSEKPYARVAYNSSHFNVQTSYNARNTLDTMRILAAPKGTIILDESFDINLDAQYNTNVMDNLNLVFGAQLQHQSIASHNTVFPNEPILADFQGVYGQAEWAASSMFKVIGSARVDKGSIYPTQFSPRGAVVITPIENQQFRLTVGRSFQRPNYSELFRKYGFAPALGARGPIDFRPVSLAVNDTLRALTGNAQSVDLGLFNPNDSVTLGGRQPAAYGIGNPTLNVESNISYEFGYKGVINKDCFVTVDVYYSELKDFISGFLPGVNPNYPAWSSKGVLPDSLKQYSALVDTLVNAQLSSSDRARLTTYNGKPAFLVSNTNIGKVTQLGFDIGVNYYITNEFLLAANYSYYSFKLVDAKTPNPNLKTGEDLLSPNTSPNRINITGTYTVANQFDVSASFRYVDGFTWLAGDFKGTVPSYSLVHLNGGVQATDNIRIGANIYNLLNNKHYEILGGTLMPRMVTVNASFTL